MDKWTKNEIVFLWQTLAVVDKRVYYLQGVDITNNTFQ